MPIVTRSRLFLHLLPSLCHAAAAPVLLSVSAALYSQTAPTLGVAGQTSSPQLLASTKPDADLPDSPGALAAARTLDASSSLISSSAAASPAEANSPDGDLFAPQDAPAPRRNPGPRATPRRSRPTDVIVAPGQIALPQTPRDRFIGSLRDSIAPFSLTGSLFSASYSHLANSAPNYGVNSAGYGERVGASLLRGTSQKVLSEAVMASLLHEDIRYYQIGRGTPPLLRVRHAVIQPFVARTESRRPTPNIAKITGYLEAAALTTAYYPDRNHGAGPIFQTFGSSLGGSAFGYIVSEFLPDALEFTHLKKISHP